MSADPTDTATPVVTCFVVRDHHILLVKRSHQVRTYQGHWSGISGYLETEEPEDQAWTELREELGATRADVSLERVGDPLDVLDDAQGLAWRVYPFRFTAGPAFEPRLDWENLNLRWIHRNEMDRLKTVPGLAEAFDRVAR